MNEPAPSPPSLAALWTGVLAGPLFWFAHQQLSVALAPWICAHGHHWLLHAATAACGSGAAAAGLISVGNLRRPPSAPLDGEKGLSRFLAWLGVLGAAFFLLTILAQGLPNFLLDPCLR